MLLKSQRLVRNPTGNAKRINALGEIGFCAGAEHNQKIDQWFLFLNMRSTLEDTNCNTC